MELVVGAPQILCFGECMIEFSRAKVPHNWTQGFAGDTYNVAAYLARLGVNTAYMTAIGHDPFSLEMKNRWAAEGISEDFTLTHATRGPGLYAIHLDDQGERSFQYWRDQSAARAFFDCDGADALMARAETVSALYVSGITLSLFDEAGQARTARLAAAVKSSGGHIIFDSNYRPKGWASAEAARDAMRAFAPHVTMALPTFEDEQLVFGDVDVDACGARWRAAGVREILVKQGAQGVTLFTGTERHHIDVPVPLIATDTTGAGDSFNAAYIAARLADKSPVAAAQAAHRLAGAVVQHHGAIIAPHLMPEGLL